ncbi:MAG: hypothetical protein AAF420_07940, partial [Pseudomonadota bacterium]
MLRVFTKALSFALLLALPLTSQSNNLTLAQIQQIAKSGTPGLALTLLDKQHPNVEQGFDEWFRWSKARTEILTQWRSWERAEKHLRNLPDGLPEPLRRWAQSQRAWLLLELSEGARAREVLRDLIWREGGRDEDPTEIALWRRLIIRSYLVEDKIVDAATAMHRYQQDFASTQPQWLALRARILLRQGTPQAVLELSPEAQAKLPVSLRMLAELRSGVANPLSVYDHAISLARAETTAIQDRPRFWLIAAEASAQREDAAGHIEALEQAILAAGGNFGADKLFFASPHALWRAYRQYGVELANSEQLLVGDDVAWLNAVLRSVDGGAYLRSKGLLAAMSEVATSEARREQAQVQLAQVINQEYGNWDIAAYLFSDPLLFPSFLHVPPAVRDVLVEEALARGDVVKASELLATLPLDGREKAFDNQLRRARVLVMGGRVSEGREQLDRILDDQLFLAPDQLDKYMQILFDLQSAEQHEVALGLFSRLEKERQLPSERRRELFYWIAESHSRQGQFDKAALYYMRSATYTRPDGADLWGQS